MLVPPVMVIYLFRLFFYVYFLFTIDLSFLSTQSDFRADGASEEAEGDEGRSILGGKLHTKFTRMCVSKSDPISASSE